jgi:hypothetical protein
MRPASAVASRSRAACASVSWPCSSANFHAPPEAEDVLGLEHHQRRRRAHPQADEAPVDVVVGEPRLAQRAERLLAPRRLQALPPAAQRVGVVRAGVGHDVVTVVLQAVRPARVLRVEGELQHDPAGIAEVAP